MPRLRCTSLIVDGHVSKEGDMFLVTLPGTVLVQALKEAEVEISASLKTRPYRGEYVFYP
jgi:hypothetical protein